MIGLGSDHNGWELKNWLKAFLRAQGFRVRDFGAHSASPVDYPDIAAEVGEAVAAGEVERAVLICGTGLGMAIAANKIPGVRAAPVADDVLARRARESNDANIITLGAWLTERERAGAIVLAWLGARFRPERSGRKVEKIHLLELRYAPSWQQPEVPV